jgi:hypothetical protein
MRRAKPFTQADIEQRQQLSKRKGENHALLAEEPSFNAVHERTIAAFVEQMPCRASMLDDQKKKFANEIRTSIQTYRLRPLAQKQEQPARLAAAFEEIIRAAGWARRRSTRSALDDLQKQLEALPLALRMELHVEDRPRHAVAPWLDRLIDAVEKRLVYWRRHVQQHRPVGEGGIGLALRQSLLDILMRYSDVSEADARRRVESLLRGLGLRVPVAKKNRALFTGKRAVTLHPVKFRQATRPSKQQRARAKRLSGLTF